MNEGPTVEPMLTDPEADLAAAVRLLGRTSVLVVGDVMLDRYVYGLIERISRDSADGGGSSGGGGAGGGGARTPDPIYGDEEPF